MEETHLISDRARERYSRQIIMDIFGEKGQESLSGASIVIVGCGATGSNLANTLTRAGVGNIKIIDRDFVELNNLQRQNLFDERDIDLPKSVAAVEKLKLINSDIKLDAEVCDFNASNAEELVRNTDLILDGTDNMSTRFIINDTAIKLGIPWIYSGAVGTYGMTMNIIPGSENPCFRCFLPNLPRPGSLQTCDTAGILNTVPEMITSYAGTEAIKLLLGRPIKPGRLLISDIWEADFRVMNIARRSDCKCCVDNDFEFLTIEKCNLCVSLCGRNAVQVRPAGSSININFIKIKDQLEKLGDVKLTDFTLIFKKDDIAITLFKDGRAIIQGVSEEKDALSVYSKYIGL
jgi:adenylyltransferase/sulfurtransferase